IGQTFVKLTDTLTWSRKSTSHIDVFANWTDPVDDGPHTPDPFARTVDAFAFQVPANRDSTVNTISFFFDHVQHVTKHRPIEYRANATTSFGEYFIEKKSFTVDALPFKQILDEAGLVSGSVHVANADTGRPYVEGIDFDVHGDPGDGEVVFPAAAAPVPEIV